MPLPRRLALLLFLLLPGLTTAQERPRRLAVLAQSAGSVELSRSVMLPELARLGFAEGRNLSVSFRHGTTAQLPALAREAMAEEPDVIFATGNDATHAVRPLAGATPIVFFGTDPVGQGFAQSLTRPGGSITGVSILAGELDGKRLDMLHQALPDRRRVAALMQPQSPDRRASERELRRVAATLGLDLHFFDVPDRAAYAGAFAAMRAQGMQALVVMATPQFFGDAATLAGLAREARLPTVCEWAEMARAGCLLGYGPDIVDLRRRAANYVARLLRGTDPAAMPIEQPTRFALGVNLQTAQALGVTLSAAVVAQADEVAE